MPANIGIEHSGILNTGSTLETVRMHVDIFSHGGRRRRAHSGSWRMHPSGVLANVPLIQTVPADLRVWLLVESVARRVALAGSPRSLSHSQSQCLADDSWRMSGWHDGCHVEARAQMAGLARVRRSRSPETSGSDDPPIGLNTFHHLRRAQLALQPASSQSSNVPNLTDCDYQLSRRYQLSTRGLMRSK